MTIEEFTTILEARGKSHRDAERLIDNHPAVWSSRISTRTMHWVRYDKTFREETVEEEIGRGEITRLLSKYRNEQKEISALSDDFV